MTNMHPKSVFRWEDAASLEHACWACPTKANSPRALQTCYGIHSVPCAAYHPTMHAIGAAHRCSGCAVAREMHDARHREIAELVAEYHDLSKPSPLSERPANLPLRSPAQHSPQDVENASNPALRKPSAAEKRIAKRARKSAHQQSKALKNQHRNPVSVTSADVEHIALIMHGDDTPRETDTHPLATDRGIEDVIARNLAFVKAIQAHKLYLQSCVAAGRRESRERRRCKAQGQVEQVVDAILGELGVEGAGDGLGAVSASAKTGGLVSPSLRSGRKSAGGVGRDSAAGIVAKLRALIKEDLEKHENEVHQTCVRAGGFWRYVGRAVFERMNAVAENMDLKSGEKNLKRTQVGSNGAEEADRCSDS